MFRRTLLTALESTTLLRGCCSTTRQPPSHAKNQLGELPKAVPSNKHVQLDEVTFEKDTAAVVRKRVILQKIVDEKARQVAFIKRKNVLFRKAMELSVLCDCDVAIVMFNPSGKLYQYCSSSEMDKLLEKYSKACQEPHERHTNEDLLRQYYTDSIRGSEENTGSACLGRKRPVEEMNGSFKRSVLTLSSDAPGTSSDVRPTSLLDRRNYPVSPRSEKAYEEITAEFDKLFELCQQRKQQGATLPSLDLAQPARNDVLKLQTMPMQNSMGGLVNGTAATSVMPGSSSGGKRFKPLSIVVPENQAHPIVSKHGNMMGSASTSEPGASTGAGTQQTGQPHGQVAHQAQQAAGLGSRSTTQSDIAGPSTGLGGGLQDGGGQFSLQSLTLPSPGNLSFGGLNSDGLLTARGGLALDFPTPDSSLNLGSISKDFDWPSPSPRDDAAGGLEDDSKSGELLTGDLMVTGTSILKLPANELSRIAGARSSEAGQHADASAPQGAGADGAGGQGAIDIPLDF